MNAGCAMNPSMDFCARWEILASNGNFQGGGSGMVGLQGGLLNIGALLADSPPPPSPRGHPWRWSPLGGQQAPAKVRIKSSYRCLAMNLFEDSIS